MSDMKYLVVKNEDIGRHLDRDEIKSLDFLLDIVRKGRLSDGKSLCNYLVVNIDEPYAGEVADIIEAGERIKGTWEHGDPSLREVMSIEYEAPEGLLAIQEAKIRILVDKVKRQRTEIAELRRKEGAKDD